MQNLIVLTANRYPQRRLSLHPWLLVEMKYCITMSLMKILENNQLVLRISIEMAAFSIENSTKNAAISIEIRSTTCNSQGVERLFVLA